MEQSCIYQDANVRKILHGELAFADTGETPQGLDYNHVVEDAVMRVSLQEMHDDRDIG
jgi:hypothetical protein